MPDLPQMAEAVVQTTNGGSIRAGVWTTAVVAVLGFLTVIIKQIVPWRKTQIDGEQALRADYAKTLAEQAARIKILEDSREADRGHCDERIEKLESHMERERTQHETEMRLLRHALNNERQVIDAILMLAKAAPDKLIDNIALITDMRSRQATAMAVEKGLAMSPATKAADDVAGAAADKANEIRSVAR